MAKLKNNLQQQDCGRNFGESLDYFDSDPNAQLIGQK